MRVIRGSVSDRFMPGLYLQSLRHGGDEKDIWISNDPRPGLGRAATADSTWGQGCARTRARPRSGPKKRYPAERGIQELCLGCICNRSGTGVMRRIFVFPMTPVPGFGRAATANRTWNQGCTQTRARPQSGAEKRYPAERGIQGRAGYLGCGEQGIYGKRIAFLPSNLQWRFSDQQENKKVDRAGNDKEIEGCRKRIIGKALHAHYA